MARFAIITKSRNFLITAPTRQMAQKKVLKNNPRLKKFRIFRILTAKI